MAECIEKSAVLSKCEEMRNAADETTQTGVDTINTIDRITDFIEAMPAADVQPVDRWISVDEALPDKNGAYLGVVDGEVMEVYYSPKGLICVWATCNVEGFTSLADSQLTHWQPLPDLPDATKG